LQHFFRKHIDAYKKLKDNSDIRLVQEGVKEIYKEIREKVIQPLTVRRTRTDLNEHDLYKNDLDEQGIVFPDIEKPKKIFYELDEELDALYDKTMLLLSHEKHGIKYLRYQAIKYLKADKKSKYKNADVASQALAKLMKTLLVKRIDSSFHAFKQSLSRFTLATEAMTIMFEKGTIFIAPNLNVNEYVMEEREDELLTKMIAMQATDPTIEICSADDFIAGFSEGLIRDFEILSELNKSWQKVNQDPKLDEFIRKLDSELLQKEINPAQKLVVFSESKETTTYLVKKLKEKGREDILEVHSDNRDKLKQTIRENFDANIPREQYKNDFNIIIATEVLAEGVNLHRSNVILNYDTPWNSTRLMQRIGRVNRIGSVAPNIYIFNFYPTAKVNSDIELEKKAIMKLQAFHSALGEDSEIYSPDEETQSFGLFEKDVDEDKDEKLGFLMELRKFKSESPELFRKIQNMPLRARVGRKDRLKNNSTICFIRNQRRDAFYLVKPDKTFEELSFVETAKEFYAVASEQGIPLHDNHHKQVSQAITDFHEKIQQEIASTQVVDTTQGPNEKKALAYLDGFLTFPFASDQEKKLIKAAKQAIKLGRFQKLQRDVNKLKRDTKVTKLKAVDLMDAMIKIINLYPVEQADTMEDRPMVTIRSYEKLKPEIIISESFAHNK
jgi:superfamily II DNA or RNA helicase